MGKIPWRQSHISKFHQSNKYTELILPVPLSALTESSHSLVSLFKLENPSLIQGLNACYNKSRILIKVAESKTGIWIYTWTANARSIDSLSIRDKRIFISALFYRLELIVGLNLHTLKTEPHVQTAFVFDIRLLAEMYRYCNIGEQEKKKK